MINTIVLRNEKADSEKAVALLKAAGIEFSGYEYIGEALINEEVRFTANYVRQHPLYNNKNSNCINGITDYITQLIKAKYGDDIFEDISNIVNTELEELEKSQDNLYKITMEV